MLPCKQIASRPNCREGFRSLLIPLPIRNDHPSTFKDIDTKQLQHPEGKMPYRRIRDWHAKCASRGAIARGWIEASETFVNFLDLSIDSSIPDLCIYQDELKLEFE